MRYFINFHVEAGLVQAGAAGQRRKARSEAARRKNQTQQAKLNVIEANLNHAMSISHMFRVPENGEIWH